MSTKLNHEHKKKQGLSPQKKQFPSPDMRGPPIKNGNQEEKDQGQKKVRTEARKGDRRRQ